MAESHWKAPSSSTSDDFIVNVERRFEDVIEHLSSPSSLPALLPATLDKNLLVISGFPFDEGSYLSHGRIGAEKAPQDLRRCVKEYLQQSIDESLGDALRVIDCGDIPKTAESSLTAVQESSTAIELPPRKKCNELSLHDAQQQQVYRAETLLQALKERPTQRGRSAAFFIGGSGDMSHCNWLAMRSVYHPSQRIGVVSIDSRVDILPPINTADGLKVHSRSSFYQLLQEATTTASSNRESTSPTFVSFAAQSSLVSSQDLAKLKSMNADVYFMESHIRRGGASNGSLSDTTATTQAGRVFCEAMKSLEAKVDVVFVSLDMQAINAAYSPGVSYPNVLGGLTGEEAIDIARVAAHSAKLVMFDVVEYSPAVEMKRTGHLLATILFNFAQALSSQK